MNKKTGLNILIGGVSLAMVASMILPGLLGNSGQPTSPVVMKVNGTDITTQTVEQVRRSNPLYSMVGQDFEGLLGDDLKNMITRRLIDNQLIFDDAKDIKVSRNEINKEITGIREQNNLQKNAEWTQALANNGLTDASFREELKKQLAAQRRRDELFEKAPAITDQQAQFFYKLNKEQYMGDPRIVGRQIVVKDKKFAEKLLKEAKNGADFAKLATKNSLEHKDRGGALGKIENGKIRSVSLVTLPEQVATAVKTLSAGEITNVIEVGGKFYIVKVDEYIKPKAKPFDQVKKEVKDQLKKAVEAQIYNNHLKSLRKNAKIEYIDQKWKLNDPIVGKIAGKEIPYSEILLEVYNNQQVANFFRQMPPEQAIGLINASMKPGVTGQIIEAYAAPEIAKKLNLSIVGPGPMVLQMLKDYAARDVKVSEEDIKAFYTQNKENFKTNASAVIKEISFNDKAKAEAFRKSYDGKSDLIEAAAQAGGTVSERGTVSSGGPGGLDPTLDKAALEDKLRQVGNTSLSNVVTMGERFVMAEVRELKPKTIQPLTEVSDRIREQLEQEKKAKVSDEFIQKKTEALKPTNNLPTILKEQKTRVEAADKARKEAEDAKKEKEKSEEKKSDSSESTNQDKSSEKNTGSTDSKEDTSTKDNKSTQDNDSKADNDTKSESNQESDDSARQQSTEKESKSEE